MKKFRKSVALVAMLLTTVLSLGACGQLVDPIDKSKTQIYVMIPNGGYGTQWIRDIAADFEAIHTKYEIKFTESKKTISQFAADVETGTNINIFYTSGLEFQSLIYKDRLADLSDILDMKVDGDDGLTIGEKIKDLETWKSISGKSGQGVYMLPWTDAISGFVYDHDLFLQKNWLTYASSSNASVKTALDEQGIIYEVLGAKLVFKSSSGSTNYSDGDYILTAGKDGIYGTYDDGQPQTLAEFDNLVGAIAASGAYPFIWAGKNIDYTTPVFNSIFANYEGVENFEKFFTYNGSYQFSGDATATELSMAEGYKVYGMTGIQKATEFMVKYLNNDNYTHPSALVSNTSHTDAQGYFLTGYKGSAQNPLSGMLCESTWWEREAKGTFNSISSEPNRGYGLRDYRYMLFPALEGQKGIDGEGNGTVMSVYDSSSFVVVKNNNTELMNAIKEFCAFTLQDKYLRDFTKTTGTVRPYEYTLSETDLSEMTPFQKTVWNIYNDNKNIAIVRPKVLNLMTPISYSSSKSTDSMWYCKVSGASYSSPLDAIQNAGGNKTQVVVQGFKEHYSSTKWADFIKEMNIFMGY